MLGPGCVARIVRRALKSPLVVPGGGAIDMELSQHLRCGWWAPCTHPVGAEANGRLRSWPRRCCTGALPPTARHCRRCARREHAHSIPGKAQLFINAFARALEVIPRQLADNSGFDATDVLNKCARWRGGGAWRGREGAEDRGKAPRVVGHWNGMEWNGMECERRGAALRRRRPAAAAAARTCRLRQAHATKDGSGRNIGIDVNTGECGRRCAACSRRCCVLPSSALRMLLPPSRLLPTLTRCPCAGGVVDTYAAFVWEPALVKINAITAAAEAACLILSVDETVRNPRSEGGDMSMGGMGGGRGMRR